MTAQTRYATLLAAAEADYRAEVLAAYRRRLAIADECSNAAIDTTADMLYGAWLMANELGAELTVDDSPTAWHERRRARVSAAVGEKEAA